MPFSVVVQIASHSKRIPTEAEFRAWTLAVFADRIKGEAGIRVVDEEEARALNRRYRGLDYATNVLAFPGGDDFDIDRDDAPVGDIVICAGVVEREAIERDCDVLAHWAHLTIHGALHLDGFDHETDEQAAVMEARETLLLAHLGFPDPWKTSTEALAPAPPALHHKC